MTTDRTILPFVKGSDTSRAAADAMRRHAPTLRQKVYDYIVSRGDYGATDDEIAVSLELRHQTASPRRRGLVIMGAVYATEERRPTRSGQTATVWRAVPGLDVRKPQGRPPKGEGETRSVKMAVYLTQGQSQSLKQLAKETERTKAEMARKLIEVGYQKYVEGMEGQRGEWL